MTVNDRLEQAKASFMSRVPEEAQSAIFRHIRELRQSGADYGLKAGSQAPDFTLTDQLGAPVNLYTLLNQGPVILIFYRGGWCPFCNIQLRAFQHMLPDIHKHNGQLLAISPEYPDHSLSPREKEELAFPVLSDPHGHAAERYNLLFELPDYLQDTYRDIIKLDLLKLNRTERWVLPVPATYLIDREGIVRYSFVNPDFMKRMEPEGMIEELRKLGETEN